jgi:hypothetical protein
MSATPEEAIASAIQGLFRATPLLLIGSGFSCGYGLPGMAELGGHLASAVDTRISSVEAHALWDGALPAIKVNLEDGLNTIPSGAPGRQEVVAAIREETARLIISRTHSAESEILASRDPHLAAPARLLRRLYNGAPQNAECIPVITTNYDTLIELFSDLAEVPIDTGFTGLRRRTARSNPIFQTQYRRSLASNKQRTSYEHRPCVNVRLMKPHGSITWQSCDGEPIEVLNDVSDAPRAIVVPGPSKYEDALINSLFDGMRGEMNAAVGRAAALLCVGFGFNDEHLQGVIRNRLEAGMPAAIITRDFTPNIREVIKRHRHVLAIQRSSGGAEAHFDGRTVTVAEPVWELDTFLKKYLE